MMNRAIRVAWGEWIGVEGGIVESGFAFGDDQWTRNMHAWAIRWLSADR
jgi:hypothetical protein